METIQYTLSSLYVGNQYAELEEALTILDHGISTLGPNYQYVRISNSTREILSSLANKLSQEEIKYFRGIGKWYRGCMLFKRGSYFKAQQQFLFAKEILKEPCSVIAVEANQLLCQYRIASLNQDLIQMQSLPNKFNVLMETLSAGSPDPALQPPLFPFRKWIAIQLNMLFHYSLMLLPITKKDTHKFIKIALQKSLLGMNIEKMNSLKVYSKFGEKKRKLNDSGLKGHMGSIINDIPSGSLLACRVIDGLSPPKTLPGMPLSLLEYDQSLVDILLLKIYLLIHHCKWSQATTLMSHLKQSAIFENILVKLDKTDGKKIAHVCYPVWHVDFCEALVLYHDGLHHELALSFLEKCWRRSDGTFFQALFLQGIIYLENESYDQAFSVFEKIAAQKSYRTSDCLDLMGCISAIQKKPWTAIEQLHQAIANDGKNVLAVFNVAMIYFNLKKHDSYSKMLDFVLQLLKTTSEDHFDPIFVIKSPKMEKLPKLAIGHLSIVRVRYWYAVSLLKQGHPAEAQGELETLLKYIEDYGGDPSLPSVVILRDYAFSLLSSSSWQKAVEVIDRVLSVEIYDVVCLIYKADALKQLTKYSEALEHLKIACGILEAASNAHLCHENESKVLGAPPNFSSFEYQNVIIKKETANYNLFDWAHRKSLKIELYNRMGIMLQCLQCYNEALKYFSICLDLNPKNRSVMFNCVLLKFKIGKKYEAFRDWMQGRSFNSTGDLSYYQKKIAEVDLNRKNTVDVVKLQLFELDWIVLKYWSSKVETEGYQHVTHKMKNQ